MKKSNLIFIIVVFLCVSFLTCQNPILETWWVPDDDDDYEYITIIKDVPIYVYETIVEDHYIYEEVIKEIFIVTNDPIVVVVEKPLPPEIMLQYIDIVGIEFIIFAGSGIGFNGGPGTFPPSKPTNVGTNLTPEEMNANDKIIFELAQELKAHNKEGDRYFIILHGHANPITFTPEEIEELKDISKLRANAVADELNRVYKGDLGENGENRMTTRGYGGGRNIAGNSSSYAGLNRRVEAILFTITTETTTGPLPPGVGGL